MQRCSQCDALLASNSKGCLCRKRSKINNTISTNVVKIGGVWQRPIGIEIEASSWGAIPAMDNHAYLLGNSTGKFIHDGSVTSGLEWASEPLVPKEYDSNHKLTSTLVDSLLAISDSLQQNAVTFDATCGYHVHIDARDWSYWEVTKVWANYINIQHWVYSLCHPDREALNARRNRYYCNRYELDLAKTLRKLLRKGNAAVKQWMTQQLFLTSTEVIADTTRRQLREALTPRYNANGRPTNNNGFSAKDLMAQKAFKYHNNRYYGFNVMPWHLQGTVELRMQGHPLDSEDIVLWPLLCCNLIHQLLNGPILIKELSSFDEFLYWAALPEFLNTYALRKQNQFRELYAVTNVNPNYARLV
jgi:hypothetical protein